jgi:hypothetical protein
MITLKKDYPFAHDGINIVEYKEGQETDKLPNDVETILVERGDACKCKAKKEEKVETETKVIEPEENKLVPVKEKKEAKKAEKKKAKKK